MIFMTLIGIAMVVLGLNIISVNSVKKKRCNEKVTAKVVNVRRMERSDEGVSFVTLRFSYRYNGTEYVSSTGNFIPVIGHISGEEVTILIDPDDPMCIYDPSIGNKGVKTGLVTVIFGLVLIAFNSPLIVIITGVFA